VNIGPAKEVARPVLLIQALGGGMGTGRVCGERPEVLRQNLRAAVQVMALEFDSFSRSNDSSPPTMTALERTRQVCGK